MAVHVLVLSSESNTHPLNTGHASLTMQERFTWVASSQACYRNNVLRTWYTCICIYIWHMSSWCNHLGIRRVHHEQYMSFLCGVLRCYVRSVFHWKFQPSMSRKPWLRSCGSEILLGLQELDLSTHDLLRWRPPRQDISGQRDLVNFSFSCSWGLPCLFAIDFEGPTRRPTLDLDSSWSADPPRRSDQFTIMVYRLLPNGTVIHFTHSCGSRQSIHQSRSAPWNRFTQNIDLLQNMLLCTDMGHMGRRRDVFRVP